MARSYLPGETREIVFTVTNTGDEPLRGVTLTDETLAGPGVVSLKWTFPDGSTATAADVAGVLTARWDATFDAGTEEWAPNAVITGVATLTLDRERPAARRPCRGDREWGRLADPGVRR